MPIAEDIAVWCPPAWGSFNPRIDKGMLLRFMLDARIRYPDAFLAGGFIRDLDMGFQPKDIDVFSFLDPDSDFVPVLTDEGTSAKDDKRVMGVEKIQFHYDNGDGKGTEWDGDMIHLHGVTGKTAREAVELFPLGIQQILYDGQLWATQNYFRDRAHRTVTVVRNDNPKDCYQIADKIVSLTYPGSQNALPGKFAGWEVIVPEKWKKDYAEFLP